MKAALVLIALTIGDLAAQVQLLPLVPGPQQQTGNFSAIPGPAQQQTGNVRDGDYLIAASPLPAFADGKRALLVAAAPAA